MKGQPTDRQRWREIEEILDRAMEEPAEGRSSFLDAACGGDSELRSEVEDLLEAIEESGNFLETSAGQYAADLLEEITLGGADAESLSGRMFGPYRVIREIGSGGMGVVCEAEDTRLNRRVALKFLPPEYGRDAAAKERFMREARAASALDHPNIYTIHDIGESPGGRLYMVLGYYEGDNLKERMARGRMSVEEAESVAIQVARALQRAHEAGIIHRDIKPANVMLSESGEVKVLDFGIAKRGEDVGLTMTGSSLGTPAYMSPEQARGEEVDGRTDIWSLGVMLYEMLTGQRPFRGGHMTAMIHSILEGALEPVERLRPEVPDRLAKAIARALEKDPEKRLQSAGEFLTVLGTGTGGGRRDRTRRRPRRPRRAVALTAALLVAALGVAGTWAWRQARTSPSSAAPAAEELVRLVGVLPLVNRTGDPSLAWQGEAVSRLVMDSLSPSRHLRVASTQRLAALGDTEDPVELARRAAQDGIDCLLTGEILAGPKGLIVAARLEETDGGRRLAARRIDGLSPATLVAASDQIAREARKGLGVPPSESVDVFAADFVSRNPEAYEHYLVGLRALPEYRYEEAEVAFAEALAAAPDFTMARYRLGQVQITVGRTEEAMTHLRRAVAEADSLADRDARYVRAAEAYFSQRLDEAIAAYRQLLERYPYETEARYLLAWALYRRGRFEEELQILGELAQLEPGNHQTWSMSGAAHLARGDFRRAMLDLKKYVDLEPDSANGHDSLADAYRAQGELELAAEEYSEALRIDPQFHSAAVSLAVIDVLRGRIEEAAEKLATVAFDEAATPRRRIDAALELASVQRSQGKFREAMATLAAIEKIVAAEEVREALALSVRGASAMELGELGTARRLIDLSIDRSPGVPTRYLFTRGLLELREGRFADLDQTIGKILEGALPPEEGNQRAEKAAAHLEGKRALAEERPDRAVEALTRAVTLDGYEYDLYRLDLARALLAAGNPTAALAAAQRAARDTDPRDPRLDLELGRVRALLALGQIKEAMGRPAEAAEHAARFLERWSRADRGLGEIAEARRLQAL